MVGLSNFPTDTLRINYLKKTFATGPIKLKLTPPGKYDTPNSQKVALTYFGSKPDIDVFHSFGDQMSAGVITALKQLEITPGKDILVLGAGGSEEIVSDIKDGSAFGTIALYPKSEADLGIEALVDSLDGKQVENPINVVNGTEPAVHRRRRLPQGAPGVRAGVECRLGPTRRQAPWKRGCR